MSVTPTTTQYLIKFSIARFIVSVNSPEKVATTTNLLKEGELEHLKYTRQTCRHSEAQCQCVSGSMACPTTISINRRTGDLRSRIGTQERHDSCNLFNSNEFL
jgi:hypothetical protein